MNIGQVDPQEARMFLGRPVTVWTEKCELDWLDFDRSFARVVYPDKKKYRIVHFSCVKIPAALHLPPLIVRPDALALNS